MHPDRGIVRTDRQLDGISTRPDGPNTLIVQSAGINGAPGDPLRGPVTCNPSWTRPNIHHVYVYGPGTPPTSQSTRALCHCVNVPPIVASGIQHYLHHLYR